MENQNIKIKIITKSNFANAHALVMLYQLREIEVKLNIIIRTMTWNKKFFHISQLYGVVTRAGLFRSGSGSGRVPA